MNKTISTIFVLTIAILLMSACSPQKPEDQVCIPKVEPAGATLEGTNTETTGNDVKIVPVEEVTPTKEEVVTTPTETKPQPVEEKPASVVSTIAIVDGVPTIEAKEGQLIALNLKAVDPDGDALSYTYSAPFDSKGEWQTKLGDVGTYFTTITASDGKAETTQKLRIILGLSNRPPVMAKIDPITVKEGEIVVLKPFVTDSENDQITLSYNGWMTSETYETTYNDAGEHYVTITASDGKLSVSQEVKVVVENVNRAPVLGDVLDITVKEGETVKADIVAFDPDKDALTYSYSKPLDSNGEWKTGFDDSGSYAATVTASDGKLTDTKAFKITVLNTNRLPVILNVGDLTVKEGETVSFAPKASDADNDLVTITYGGWMSGSSYTTTYGDAGEHVVEVIANDGTESVTQKVTVTVLHVNRPPVFQLG